MRLVHNHVALDSFQKRQLLETLSAGRTVAAISWTLADWGPRSHAPAMFVVSEAEAAAIRTAFEQSGELSAAVELRRLFPGITEYCACAGMGPDHRRLEAVAATTAQADAEPASGAMNKRSGPPKRWRTTEGLTATGDA